MFLPVLVAESSHSNSEEQNLLALHLPETNLKLSGVRRCKNVMMQDKSGGPKEPANTDGLVMQGAWPDLGVLQDLGDPVWVTEDALPRVGSASQVLILQNNIGT